MAELPGPRAWSVRKGDDGATGIVHMARVLFIESGDKGRAPRAFARDVGEAIPENAVLGTQDPPCAVPLI